MKNGFGILLVVSTAIAVSMAPAPTTAAVATYAHVNGASRSWDLFGLAVDDTTVPHTLTKATPDQDFPYLPTERDGRSMSIGTVTDGRIVNALPLPLPGRTYGVLPRQIRRHLTYGSEELIAGLVAASEYVADVFPGTVMWLGNIGRHGGGDIPWSVSHNSGRDADIAFYTTDPDGNPVQPPDLLHYRGNGRSAEYGGYYRFDDARNWALVKALVLSPHVQLQYLFISDPLRDRLLYEARSRGEPPAVVERAAMLMQQPGREIPHDDHLHVRIYCSRADRGAGCENTGRVRPGVDLFRSAPTATADQAARLLRDGDPEVRQAAVERLAFLNATSRIDLVRRRLSDPSPTVRAAAVDAIARLGSSDHVGWLVMHWEEEEDDFVRERLVRAAGTLGGRDAGLFFARLLDEPAPVEVGGKRYDLRYEVVDAIRSSARAEPAYGLVSLLATAEPELAARAADTLRHLSNRSLDDLDWRQRPSSLEVATAAPAWRRWLDDAADTSRDEWVADGFAMLGVPMAGSASAVAAELARMVDDERDWVSVNAQRQLMRMTGNSPRSLDWPRGDAETYWVRWVRRNPGRVAWR